jgi:signal transduction histidine kinase
MRKPGEIHIAPNDADRPVTLSAARNQVADDTFRRALKEHLQAYYLADAAGRLVETSLAFAQLCARLSWRPAPKSGEHAPAQLRRIFERIRATRSPVHLTENVRVDDEARTYRSTHFPVFDAGGALAGFGGVYADRTEASQAESRLSVLRQRYEDFLRSTSDWIWEASAELRLTHVSPRIAAVLGEPAPRLIGRPLLSLGIFAPPGDGRPAAKDLIESRLPFRNQQLAVKSADGESRHIHLSGVAVFDDATGRFLGYRGTGTDMTRQIAAESFAHWARGELETALERLKNQNTELDLALAKAQAADEAKSNFLAMMSHELRTPLNAVIGFSECAVKETAGPLPKPYRDYADEVLVAGRQLLRLVEVLLDLANLESGRLDVDIRPTALRAILAEAWMQVSLRAEERAMGLAQFVAPDGNQVLVDPARARQIFVNLLSNAVKYGDPGGRIGIECLAPQDAYAETVVWNTGGGIPADDRQSVFDDLHGADRSVYRTRSEDTGLGLTLARRLARLMGGEIELDQQADDLVRFVVRLPLVPGAQEGDATVSAARPPAEGPDPAPAEGGRRARVTIIRLPDS